MCCDGGLFDLVKLSDEDRSRFQEHGLAAPESLAHPCPHFAAPACTIYAIRPWRCSDYRCEVLAGMMAGTIEPDAAHALVDQALAMRALVRDVLPAEVSIVELARDLKAQSPQDRSPGRLQAMARLAAFRVFVERHFLGPKSRWLTGKDE